ncbi:MAG TPA: ABC transporter permease [Micromonosporaceae bacterium]
MSPRKGQVPVTARLLAARPVRTGAGILGIGLALMLMLLLNGLWTGVQQRVTVYDDHLGADLVVVPPGTRSLFADPGVLPAATATAIEGVPGVTDASLIRTMYLILELPHGKAAVAAVASETGGPGGPWSFAEGRAAATAEEVAVDALFADQHGLGLGDRLAMFGHQMRVVGLTEDTAMFMTPLLFTTADAMTGMLGAGDTTGAVLVSTDNPGRVAERLRDQGLTVRTPTQLREASLTLATKIYGSPVKLMVGVAFAAGTLIVALVAYTRVTEQQRDLGVLKALGATPGRIRRVAVTETVALTAAGAVVAVLLLLLTRELLAWWRPAFPVALTAETVARTAAAAAVMAVLAAWLPARRLNRLDAATAFRSR